MKRVLECAACVVVAVLATTAVNSWGASATSDRQAGGARAGGTKASPLDSAIESKYTSIEPCRIVDTRKAGGALQPGTNRSFVAAKTTGFAAQGGESAGCAIPAAATAIQVSVTAVDAVGDGFLRVSAGNVSTSSATFMNFTDSFNVTGAGSIAITPSNAAHFKVYGNGSATHVVVDVQGYFVKPITAGVTLDGDLVLGHRGISATRTATGRYTVTFDRNINVCSTVVTTLDDGAIASVTTSTTAAFVAIFEGGVAVNRPFYMSITC